MHSFFQHRPGHYLLMTALALPLFFWNLGGATLWDLDEGRNAVCAFEMMLSDNWVVPTFNGALRDHKPVLIYWLQIFAYQIGGMNETMARLPSALASLLTLFVAYEIGRRMFSKTTGLLAGLACAASPMQIGAARFANPDALLNLFTALTFLFAWINYRRPSAWGAFLVGAAMGMSMLAKGPVGIVLPGAAIVAFLVWQRRWSQIFDRRLGWTLLAFLLVAAPWYTLVGVVTHGKFLKGFLWGHNADRFLATMENHRGSILYYPIVILVGSMPWSLFAAGTAWASFWSCRNSPTGKWQPAWDRAADQAGRGGPAAYQFLTCWLLIYLVFFSISATKLPNYVLPVIVPFMLLTARFLDRWRKDALALPTWYLATSAAGFALIGIVIGSGLAVAAGVGELTVMRNRFLPNLLPFAAIGLMPIAAAGVLLLAVRRDRRGLFVGALVLSAGLLLAPLAAFATSAFNDVKVPAAIAQTPAGRDDVDLRVIALDQAHLPSLNFYLRRDVCHMANLDEIVDQLRLPLPMYALIPADRFEELQRQHPNLAIEVSRQTDMYRGTQAVLATNRVP